MSKGLNRILGVFLVLAVFVGVVSSQETYIEAISSVREQVVQSEENVKKEINSFNGAFQEAFKLIDDEVSRLIFANAAMVGLVFAIMFLVYAKTSSKSRRDVQVMLVAHSKHIDNMVSAKLDEFTRRLEQMMEEKRRQDMSALESLDDTMKGAFTTDEMMTLGRRRRKSESVPEAVAQITEAVAQETSASNTVEMQPVKKKRRGLFGLFGRKEEKKEEIIYPVPEQKVKDIKTDVPREPSQPGSRFLRRLKRGLMRILGRSKHREKVEEFRLK
jgi:hypothetical protein